MIYNKILSLLDQFKNQTAFLPVSGWSFPAGKNKPESDNLGFFNGKSPSK
jgi:hypothetical protein